MRLTPFLLTLCLSCVAVSKTLSLFGSGQQVLDDELAVPGDNPLFYCQSTEENILHIDYVDLTPNPPEAGKTLTIKAHGNFTEAVEKGAYMLLQVKYGLITLIKQTADLCEQMSNVDEECPLSGEKTITKDVDLPKTVPPGKYTVSADVYTKDDGPIICLTATVHFGSK